MVNWDLRWRRGNKTNMFPGFAALHPGYILLIRITSLLYPHQIYVTFLRVKIGCNARDKKAEKLPTLEESLSEITQLIDKMEHGELTLEQSLTNFERGITLIKHCQKVLQEAEQKVQILIQNNAQEELATYGDDDKDKDAQENA